jgi:type VI protein secretion system component VasK
MSVKSDQKKRREQDYRHGSAVKSSSFQGSWVQIPAITRWLKPSVMRSDVLFWCVWRQLQCTHINKINKSLKEEEEKEEEKEKEENEGEKAQRVIGQHIDQYS